MCLFRAMLAWTTSTSAQGQGHSELQAPPSKQGWGDLCPDIPLPRSASCIASWLEMSLLIAEGAEEMTLKVASNPNSSMIPCSLHTLLSHRNNPKSWGRLCLPSGSQQQRDNPLCRMEKGAKGGFVPGL